MKIAVTTENNQIFQHFGKCSFFTVYTIENNQIADKTIVDANGSGHSALAGLLMRSGVNLLICGGIGAGARQALSEYNIEVVAGASGEVDEAVKQFLSGSLKDSPLGSCNHHHEGGHSCGEHTCGGHH